MSENIIATEKPTPSKRRKRIKNPMPGEGDNGIFTQTWWPICTSSEIRRGGVVGYDFLDGRVVVMRGENGIAQVLSAYCPHLGADLSVGDVVGNNVRCAFHHWEYDQEGQCTKTGIGDPVPPNACLYNFPTEEKYGIIWAFNGDEPLFELPGFAYPDEDILIKTTYFPGPIKCDGWVFSCNTPDFQHLRSVHGCVLDTAGITDEEWTPYSMKYHALGQHRQGEPFDYYAAIYGSNIFLQNSTIADKWLGVLVPFTCPRPGEHGIFSVCAVLRGDGSAEQISDARKWLDEAVQMENDIGMEDFDILNTIHYTPGTLTKSDAMLAKFLKHLREYPRAHPSADFIN